jgi:hypothetical protein
VQIYAITEQPDGSFVVTARDRVLVSVFDHERRLEVCLERIVAEAGSSWAAVMTPSGLVGADALVEAATRTADAAVGRP